MYQISRHTNKKISRIGKEDFKEKNEATDFSEFQKFMRPRFRTEDVLRERSIEHLNVTI